MKSVSNGVATNYTAADVGILTPPDRLKRYRCATDAELEKKFKTVSRDVYSKQKHISFEDKKKTPALIKFILGGGLLVLFWQVIKAFKK